MELVMESKFLISVVIIFLSWLTKVGITSLVKKKFSQEGKDRRDLINTLKNGINLVMVIALFSVWSAELQKFAISIAAFIVAIVLATKEIIQCVIGFIYLTSTKPFRVGDWVQVGDFIGEVAETDWAKITISEVELVGYGYTGKTLFIPNSQLLTQPIRNLSYMRRYVNHAFTLIKENDDSNPNDIKKALLTKAKNYCEEFKDTAKRYSAHIEKRLDVQISGPEPSIKLSTTDLGKIKFTVNIFCPTHKAKPIEQMLTGDFFGLLHEQQKNTLEQPVIATTKSE
jgi:small-conductance mechanosensitive channel